MRVSVDLASELIRKKNKAYFWWGSLCPAAGGRMPYFRPRYIHTLDHDDDVDMMVGQKMTRTKILESS